ncbi:MAG: PIN domain-containing protein [Candidatus Omnitrophota bacterium]
MRQYVIDTNALISFVTDRNPEQQKQIATLFETAAYLKARILCHQHVITEFIYVMDKIYRLPKEEIAGMVADLIAMPGIEIIQEIDFAGVLSCWPDPIPDFGDAVIASSGKAARGATVVTFVRKLIERLKLLDVKHHSF